jgi:hypothetical protein
VIDLSGEPLQRRARELEGEKDWREHSPAN